MPIKVRAHRHAAAPNRDAYACRRHAWGRWEARSLPPRRAVFRHVHGACYADSSSSIPAYRKPAEKARVALSLPVFSLARRHALLDAELGPRAPQRRCHLPAACRPSRRPRRVSHTQPAATGRFILFIPSRHAPAKRRCTLKPPTARRWRHASRRRAQVSPAKSLRRQSSSAVKCPYTNSPERIRWPRIPSVGRRHLSNAIETARRHNINYRNSSAGSGARVIG